MVITLMLALASAFLLSLTVVPALAAILFCGGVAESEVAAVRVAKRLYAPALRMALAHPWSAVAAGIITLGAAIVVFDSLGRVFIPTLDEINVDLASVRIPSISMEQSKDIDFKVERALLTLPEVNLVFSKAGTANLVFDAMTSNYSDNYMMLKPKDQWPPSHKGRRRAAHCRGHGAHRRKFL